MNTRRYPRTLQEAFGPYTSHDLIPMREPSPFAPLCALVVAFVAACAMVITRGRFEVPEDDY